MWGLLGAKTEIPVRTRRRVQPLETTRRFSVPLTILCLALSTSAFAGDFGPLYNNGPTNGTNNAYFIDAYVVSDSFLVDPTSDGISVGFGSLNGYRPALRR